MRPILLAALLVAGPALAEPPRVVADIPVTQSLAAQVMGDLGAPEVLLGQGASPHHYQLRPSQAAALAGADLVVWVGPELTPWLDRALDGAGGNAARLSLLAAGPTHRRSYGEPHDHDHADDHAHEEDHGHAEDDHDHSGLDPHAWLDPGNAAAWLGLIAAELARLDPENAAIYAANAEAAQAGIATLEAELTQTLAPAREVPLIVFHDAYGYLAGHFGLTIAGSLAEGDAASPGAARLAALRQTIAAAGTAPCVFPEAQQDPALVEAAIEGTRARRGAPLDPEGSSLAYGSGLYAELMRGLAAAIAACAAAP